MARAAEEQARQLAAAEDAAKRERARLRRAAYDRGRITEAEFDALIKADALPPDRPDGAAYATVAPVDDAAGDLDFGTGSA